jgi:formylglycine-generating enzyme required for sulfatase activity
MVSGRNFFAKALGIVAVILVSAATPVRSQSSLEPAAVEAHARALRAAENGDPQAQWDVAHDLLDGHGTVEDPVEALMWLKKALALGYKRASRNIPIAEQRISEQYVALDRPRTVLPDALTPGRRIEDCADCPVMIVLPRGTFTMGGNPDEAGHSLNEEPRHQVRIDHDIAVSETLITFDQWDACVRAGKCPADVNDMGWGRGDRPAINISWDHVRPYIEWLNSISPGGYRLLSEAEWEFAAKAGTDTTYWWGDMMEPGRANCDGCNPSTVARTVPVRTFPANPFGLFDMSGNAWQWVGDCVGNAALAGKPNYSSAPATGSAWLFGNSVNCTVRIIRGGAWDYDASFARASARNWYFNISRYADCDIGFRIALSLKAASGE